MRSPKVCILRTAGTNCDEETAHAWELAGAEPQRVHVQQLIDNPTLLREYAILTIPGGFSYGDDISAGKILATQLEHYLADAVREFVDAGKFVLGICNGFQVLVKAGLLPGGTDTQSLTLSGNDSAKFECRWIHLKTTARENAFLPTNRVLSMPIAHAEGKLVVGSDAERQRLVDEQLVAVSYCDESGQVGGYPINPNGSDLEAAGLIDATGRVFGLMPHPERHVNPTQHPHWGQRQAAAHGKAVEADGIVVFTTAVENARA